MTLAAAHQRLRAAGRDVFLLSTCLRVEIVWAGDIEDTETILGHVYGEAVDAADRVIRRDEEAFRHLCRIAAGLDTPITGEVEVLGQFRRAVSAFYEGGGSRGGLGRVLEMAVSVGRSARRHLDDQPRGSLATLAAGRVASFDRVGILGSGAMARSAAENLDSASVTVFARRPAVVAGHETRPWEEVVEAMGSLPAFISTIPGKAPLSLAEEMGAAIEGRSEPLTLIDLGMPPVFDRFSTPSLVQLVGVDEVAAAGRGVDTTEAEDRVRREAEASWRRLGASDRAGAVIAAIVGNADRAVDEEVRRFALRLTDGGDAEAVLRQLAHTVARRVLHSPISYIGSTERGAEPVDLLADAFGVQDA